MPFRLNKFKEQFGYRHDGEAILEAIKGGWILNKSESIKELISILSIQNMDVKSIRDFVLNILSSNTSLEAMAEEKAKAQGGNLESYKNNPFMISLVKASGTPEEPLDARIDQSKELFRREYLKTLRRDLEKFLIFLDGIGGDAHKSTSE